MIDKVSSMRSFMAAHNQMQQSVNPNNAMKESQLHFRLCRVSDGCISLVELGTLVWGYAVLLLYLAISSKSRACILDRNWLAGECCAHRPEPDRLPNPQCGLRFSRDISEWLIKVLRALVSASCRRPAPNCYCFVSWFVPYVTRP